MPNLSRVPTSFFFLRAVRTSGIYLLGVAERDALTPLKERKGRGAYAFSIGPAVAPSFDFTRVWRLLCFGQVS